jgi:3-dehydroquinate dehydratase/shikimate dehydrogenase
METTVYIVTDRLFLRDWTDADAAPFAEMNADPRVMEFFPAILSGTESDTLMEWIRARMHEKGYGMYAAEEKNSGRFIGFIGLAPIDFEAHFTPAIEIGWRLAQAAWGKGLATEGANAVLAHTFGQLGLNDLVSITTVKNQRSRRVMEKIGMTHSPSDDFPNPKLPPGHPQAPHVLYRIKREDYLQPISQAAG